MLSRRLTPAQRLATIPFFILGGFVSLSAGRMLADEVGQTSTIVGLASPSPASATPQARGAHALARSAPTATPTPATRPSGSKTAPVAVGVPPSKPSGARPGHDDGHAAHTKNPPAKGGHGKDKGHHGQDG